MTLPDASYVEVGEDCEQGDTSGRLLKSSSIYFWTNDDVRICWNFSALQQHYSPLSAPLVDS